jgi:hypothetical protein
MPSNLRRYLFVMLLCGCAYGQTDHAPLVCPKYQHWQESSVGCSYNGSFGFCDKIIPAQCVDDMHWLTEREWQDILATLKGQNDSLKIINQTFKEIAKRLKEKAQ